MKTPFDTALRIADRRLDAVSAAIGVVIDELRQVESAQVALETRIAREMRAAEAQPIVATSRYFDDARTRREELARDRADAQQRLEALRRDAVEAYGAQRALQTAIEHHVADAVRSADAAEQAAIDDMIGARHATTRARHRTPEQAR